MKHELVRLAQAIDWPVPEERFGAVYSDSQPCACSDRARQRKIGQVRLGYRFCFRASVALANGAGKPVLPTT